MENHAQLMMLLSQRKGRSQNTYWEHKASKKPVDFSNVKETDTYPTGIDHTIKDIDHFQDQITNVQKAVRGVTSLDDALKGKGGDAIHAFWQKESIAIFLSA